MKSCISKRTLYLYQPQDGYCYNSDTHFLFYFITKSLTKYKNITGDLLDIGSGSGILGLMLKREYPKLNLHQIEKQDIFRFLSQKNSNINKIDSILYQDDYLSYNFTKKYDLIVSNPPFYSNSVIKSQNKILNIARYEHNLPLEQLIIKTSKLLKPKGRFYFCYDAKQLNRIFKIFLNTSLNIEAIQFLYPTKNKDASVVMIYARANSKTPLSIYPPLIMLENQEFTQTTQEIYQYCDTYSIKFYSKDIVI